MLGARQRLVRGSAQPLQPAYVSGCLADTWRISCYSRGMTCQPCSNLLGNDGCTT